MKKYVLILFTTIMFISLGAWNITGNAATYQVKKGDTLWDIAIAENVTVEQLLAWNELNSSLIFPGQEIHINHKKDVYIVQKGDTLSQVAEAHNITLSDLKHWNQMTSHLIFPGDELATDGKQRTAVAGPAKEKAVIASPPEKQQTQQPAQKSQPTTQVPTAAAGKEMTVTATAYTAYCTGCSGTTYTGINLRANPNQKVIAVDPSVIPLGSRVWVEGYGEAIAGDIGGAIKGNIIDVFLEHKQEALNWGRRTVKIKVLE